MNKNEFTRMIRNKLENQFELEISKVDSEELEANAMSIIADELDSLDSDEINELLDNEERSTFIESVCAKVTVAFFNQ